MSPAKTFSEKLTEFRKKFPALKNKSYFNYGALGVLSEEALNEIDSTYRYVQEQGPFGPSMLKWLFQQIGATRQSFATAFGGAPENYALTTSVTDGCNIIFWGIDWQDGDNLITTNCEHIGVVGAIGQLARRQKLNVKHIDVSESVSDEQIITAIEKAIDERTRLVAISHVLWNTGRVLPVAPIQRLCNERAVRVLLDGAQSAGVIPLDFRQLDCDYYAITGHKWVCGPEGLAALYVRPGLAEELEPTFVGWRGVRIGEDGTISGWEPEATRFEVATAPFPLMPALRLALKAHDDFASQQERYDLVLRGVARLKDQLLKVNGLELAGDYHHKSSLVSFKMSAHDQKAVVKQLEEHNVLIRTIPQPDAIRASVHYFTSDEEIDALVEALRAIH